MQHRRERVDYIHQRRVLGSLYTMLDMYYDLNMLDWFLQAGLQINLFVRVFFRSEVTRQD